MKKFLLAFGVMALVCKPALSTTIDFGDLSPLTAIESYYAGGTDSDGNVGPDYGVTFSDDWFVGSVGIIANVAISGNLGEVDFAYGFTGSLIMSYLSHSDMTINIYSGLGESGMLLASILAPESGTGTFDFLSLPFAGTAHSFAVVGDPFSFGLDYVTFTPASTVPEPASWAMLLGGLGAAGGIMRRRPRAIARLVR